MRYSRLGIVVSLTGIFALAAPLGRAAESAGAVAAVSVSAEGLSLAPQVDYDRLIVTVVGPGDVALRREFDASSGLYLPFEARLGDGTYAYEVRSAPRVDAATREALAAARESGDEALQERLAARLPRGAVQSGYFTVLGGQVVPGDLREPQAAAEATRAPSPDTTFTDSVCVGFDCPASPTFSDSTILLMENNTRIKYDDTSSLAGFPNRDWALNANDSASGGANRFWLQDCGNSSQGGCSGNAVFSVEAGARNNALYVDDSGRLGLGTSTPVLDIHNVRGNTPSLRLEQDGSSGFAPQTWDVAGNEANFFIRDVTGGSKLPLRIRPGAPTSSIDISSTGNVGIGIAAPTKPLHVSRSDGNAQVLITETNATNTTRTLLSMTNNGGPVRMTFSNGLAASTWAVDNDASSNFVINKIDGDGAEMTLDGNGNLTITGIYSPSDRNLKTDVVNVDRRDVLAKVAQMPISFWRYKEGSSDLHVGPMAQDFVGAFGLGPDDKRISPSDVGGVALAAIQALNDVVNAKDARIAAQAAQIEELRQSNAELAERLAAIERALASVRP